MRLNYHKDLLNIHKDQLPVKNELDGTNRRETMDNNQLASERYAQKQFEMFNSKYRLLNEILSESTFNVIFSAFIIVQQRK